MSFIQWYKYIALASAFFWLGLGTLTMGSILVSSLGWAINLIMGLFFILIGLYLRRRANSFYLFYVASSDEIQNNQHLCQFLRLDFFIVLGSSLVGGVLLLASLHRVFLEGFAVFG